jgi:hypothetical protein
MCLTVSGNPAGRPDSWGHPADAQNGERPRSHRMAAAARKLPAQKTIRRDPKRVRAINGTSPWATLMNQRPDRKYVLAAKADSMYGVSYYEAIGYSVEMANNGPNALRFIAGTAVKPGEPLESLGHVAMSIDLETWEQIEQFGVDGNGGQDFADTVEKRMLSKRGFAEEALRGLGAQEYMAVENETQLVRDVPGVATDPFE